MSRRTVFIVSAVTVALFVGLVYYGWEYRWGAPSGFTLEEPPVLGMPRMDATLTLQPPDFEGGVWDQLPALPVRLMHQITTPPRARYLVPEVHIRAFHDGNDAYFLLEWEDDLASRVHDVAKFPDCAALGFSLAKEPPGESIMMGFQSLMNMWFWRANLDEAFWGGGPRRWDSPNVHYTYEEAAGFPVSTEEVKGACEELLAVRAGSLTPKEETAVSGRGMWRDGRWRVLFKRPLFTDDKEESVQFALGRVHMTVAVWDGDKGQRGARKSISDWIILDAGARSAARLAAPEEPQDPEITVLARRFQYEPSEITVQKGDVVTLRLESADVTHGLYMDGYGIDIKARPGKVGKATFVADKPGRFTFRCSETCGEFHPYMIGYLTVEPNSRFSAFVVFVLVAAGLITGLTWLGYVRRKREGTPDA